MALRTQDQGDSQVLDNNQEWKVTMLRQAKTPAALMLSSQEIGTKTYDTWAQHEECIVWDFTVLRAYLHLGSTRYPRLWTMSSRNIITDIDKIFRRLICGYYEWERRTLPRTTLATRSIGAVWTNAFLEMEGEQTCYLKTLTLVRHRGPTTMQVSSRKAKKVQSKKLQQWTTTVT